MPKPDENNVEDDALNYEPKTEEEIINRIDDLAQFGTNIDEDQRAFLITHKDKLTDEEFELFGLTDIKESDGSDDKGGDDDDKGGEGDGDGR